MVFKSCTNIKIGTLKSESADILYTSVSVFSYTVTSVPNIGLFFFMIPVPHMFYDTCWFLRFIMIPFFMILFQFPIFYDTFFIDTFLIFSFFYDTYFYDTFYFMYISVTAGRGRGYTFNLKKFLLYLSSLRKSLWYLFLWYFEK